MSGVVIGLAITGYLLIAWRLMPWFTRVAHRDVFETGDAVIAALLWPMVFVVVAVVHTGRWFGRAVEARAYADEEEPE